MKLYSPVMTKTVFKNAKIGDFTYGKPTLVGPVELEIGKFTSIAGDVVIIGMDHRKEWATTYPFPALFPQAQHITGHPVHKGPVKIGHDVWIGQGATIMSGVTIGNGAIIAANAVVARNVAPYAIVAGNPSSQKSFRFAEEWCDFLNRKLKWWDWPIETILARVDDLCKPPGDHLMKYLKKEPKA